MAEEAKIYKKADCEVVNFANNVTANHEFTEVPMDRIRRLLRDADSPQAECVVVVCTNLAAALVVEEGMEQELGRCWRLRPIRQAPRRLP